VQHSRARVAWAHRAFDVLILPATSVSFPCASSWFSNFSGSLKRCGSPSTCSGQFLAVSSRRRAQTARELRAERAQLEMQLVVPQLAATVAVASEGQHGRPLKPPSNPPKIVPPPPRPQPLQP
jgi:hypothetical protein